ncbi:MAG: hypothetical protein ACKOXO_02680 [Cyanobium sp.]
MYDFTLLSDLEAEQVNGGAFFLIKDNTVNAAFASIIQGNAVVGEVKKADVPIFQKNQAFIIQRVG